jgi:hypothetical protein
MKAVYTAYGWCGFIDKTLISIPGNDWWIVGSLHKK